MTAHAPHGHARTTRTARPLPAQRDPLAAQRDPLEAARLALARAMQRGEPPTDQVRFTAACPACGADREWRESRMETRLRVEIDCDCAV